MDAQHAEPKVLLGHAEQLDAEAQHLADHGNEARAARLRHDASILRAKSRQMVPFAA